jgi:hypothetical protein
MRTLVAFLLFSAPLLQAQDHKPISTCPGQGHGSATDSYYDAVVERSLRPANWQTSLITMSISVNSSESRLILREQSGKFELLRGTVQNSIHKLLLDLDSACKLPPNPIDAARRVKVDWESVQISPEQFDQMHREFAAGLSQYASIIQARYASLLSTGTAFVNLHTTQYSFVFDNKYEHIEIRASDTTDDPSKMDPIVRWIRAVLKLSEESFRTN